MKDKLWCDLKSFKEERDFIALGMATKTGIIAHALQPHLLHDYNALLIAIEENEQLRAENDELKAVIRYLSKELASKPSHSQAAKEE